MLILITTVPSAGICKTPYAIFGGESCRGNRFLYLFLVPQVLPLLMSQNRCYTPLLHPSSWESLFVRRVPFQPPLLDIRIFTAFVKFTVFWATFNVKPVHRYAALLANKSTITFFQEILVIGMLWNKDCSDLFFVRVYVQKIGLDATKAAVHGGLNDTEAHWNPGDSRSEVRPGRFDLFNQVCCRDPPTLEFLPQFARPPRWVRVHRISIAILNVILWPMNREVNTGADLFVWITFNS